MSVACTRRGRRLVDDPDLRDDHVESCLRCQVEAVRHRQIRRRLAVMREEVIEAPPGLLPAVMAGLDGDEASHKKAAGLEAAVAAASLAAVAGALALWRRSVSA